MSQLKITAPEGEWNKSERLLFRIVFIYFILQAVPLDWKYYWHLFQINWPGLHYRDLFYIARYTPQFVSATADSSTWGLNTLYDWAIIFLLSVAGAAAWSFYDNKRKEYNNLYYLLRVILRYRLAIGIIAYGFIKFFPSQLPYPSVSLENTNYGDLSDWKITSLTYGVAPSFEVYLGAVEILAGILLLNRKTASVGAAVVIGFTGNVFLSNLGYGGGEAVYCLYLLNIAVVIVFYDVFRWHRIIVLGEPALPNRYHPAFFTGWKKRGRVFFRAAFVIFAFVFYGYYSYAMYRNDPYQYPKTKGLAGAGGLYNVSTFRVNGINLPYSLTDSVRWQNVVFEKWNTLSIRLNRDVKPDMANSEEIFVKDEDRTYESSGSTGRLFYRYTVDTSKHALYLVNKNKNYPGEKLMLKYARVNDNSMVLQGINAQGDSIYVVLDKLPKIYLLDESFKIPRNRSVFVKQKIRN